ncbi:hypothetical protein J5X07_09435 [Actinomyces bowdenii]|uniref:sterol carrier family protein n=1 Tax=Actinomyces bowdenii TaxID=131109 RepID=UPI001ABC79E5|nr:sterol carrier family protein [Actinomyces bowdenii]MBO3725245.1 hypothetical protein [Actinomyces bowdenii]
MTPPRRIDPDAGAQAVRRWAAYRAQDPEGPETGPAHRAQIRRTTATAVRYTLEELAACAPGRAVEVRVPPFGATQAVAGAVHRRGTPPSVVETGPETWLALATGALTWEEALRSGALRASGERCDLSAHLPLVRP